MPALKEKTVSVRLIASDYALLENQARRQSSKPARMGSVLLSYQLRRLNHPAIDFQALPEGGFVARLAGRRLSVWLVVDLVLREGQRQASATLGVPPSLIVAALNYAAEFAEEIAADTRLGQRTVKECGLELPA